MNELIHFAISFQAKIRKMAVQPWEHQLGICFKKGKTTENIEEVTCPNCLKELDHSIKVHLEHKHWPEYTRCGKTKVKYKTTDPALVTCKSCRRSIDKARRPKWAGKIHYLIPGAKINDEGFTRDTRCGIGIDRHTTDPSEVTCETCKFWMNYRPKSLGKLHHQTEGCKRYGYASYKLTNSWDEVTCKFCLKKKNDV